MDRASMEKANWFRELIKPDCEISSADGTPDPVLSMDMAGITLVHNASVSDITSLQHRKLAITNLLNPKVIPEPVPATIVGKVNDDIDINTYTPTFDDGCINGVSHSADMDIDTDHANSTRGLSDNNPSVKMDNSHGDPSIASNPCVTNDGVAPVHVPSL